MASSLLPEAHREVRREARRVLQLERSDRRAAEQALASLSLEAQVAVVCEAPLAQRASILELTPYPEAVIPLLPEAELCFTVKAVGLHDASWILEYATQDQIVAAVDLDAWSGLVPDVSTLDQWIAAFAEANDSALLRATQSLDPELIVLYLRAHAEVELKPAGDDAEDWVVPAGAQTLDGQFYLTAKRDDDDLAPLLRMLHVLFQKDYWLYFRMLQGVIWELPTELEEWALRWRTGRLEDLGFPSWDEAMRIYGFVRPEQRAALPDEGDALDVAEWRLPVWMSELPAPADDAPAVFRALRELDAEERRSFFFAFVALANKVAVADGMPLGDAETTPRAVQKAALAVSRGLEHIARERDVALADVLRRASLTRLFRVGASIERSGDA
ncbi:MAG: DUF6178 family protein [Proteobacteria bacterium]|nr:DUF6178 family protein [Pseudomonadota bacterium]